jgi:nucleoid-associated protein YgaU
MDRDEALRRQFVREARIGIGLIGLFGAIFLGVAISKFRDRYFSDDLEKIVSDKPPVLVAESPHSALQAATTSVIDQVAPRPGDTSATRPPPMPAPKSFPNTGEVPENPAERSTPTPRLDNPSQEPTTVTRQDSALEALEDKSLAASAQSLDPRPRDPSPAPIRFENNSFDFSAIGANPQEGIAELPPAYDPNARSDSEAPIAPIPADFDSQIAPTRSAAALPVQPTQPSIEEVVIEAGQPLSSIARRKYGDERWAQALAAFNHLPTNVPDGSQTGRRVRIPPRRTLAELFPRLVPAAEPPADSCNVDPTVYLTAEGDTLFSIAREHLGQASRYVEIFELNRDSIPADATAGSKLPAGVHLILPQ